VRAFEIAWEQQPDVTARARAVSHLNAAVTNFFSFKLDEAARSLDQARFAMQPAPPLGTTIWAAALLLKPEARLVDRGSPAVSVSLAPFYTVKGDMPKAVVVHVSLLDGSGKEVAAAEGEVGKLPWQGKLPLAAVPEGDCQLVGEIVIGKDHIRLNPQTVSVMSDPAKRLKGLEDGLAGIKAKPNTTQRATLASHMAILKSLFAKETPETNYPAARLLAESEAGLKVIASGGYYFGKARPGEFWITLADEHGILPVRIMAPEAVATGKPLPLVIALHGAGGSENMFFDAYGNGKIVDLCRKRGWLLVAPRLSFFGLGMSVDSIVAEIGRLYPVENRQILVVGHSMGAMQAVNIAQQTGHPAIRDEMDALGFEPGLQGQNQGVVLVVDGSLDASKSLNAGKFEHEAIQVTLEFNGTVPGLEGKSGGPHGPEFRLEERGRKPVCDASRSQCIFVGLGEFQQFDAGLHREPH
jgi:hypothetical protein